VQTDYSCLYQKVGDIYTPPSPSPSPSPSPCHISTDGQSVSLSWCRAPAGAHDHLFVTVRQLLSCLEEGALSDERVGLSFVRVSLK
jgi:hypothetical protein